MRSLFYKKCEVCGSKVDKLQSWWNIFLLKTGKKLQCSNCNTQYETNKYINFIGSFYVWFWIWVVPILLIVKFIDSFGLDLGIEVWLYAVIIYSLIEFLIMVILPLKKAIEENKKDK